jgi:stage IV sporulation protein FA
MEYQRIWSECMRREAEQVEVRANVQKRRLERIRELQSRRSGTAERWTAQLDQPKREQRPLDQLPAGTEQPPGIPLYIRGHVEPPDHGGDPEVAWNQRQKQLLQWYSSQENDQEETTAAYSTTRQGSRGGEKTGGGGPSLLRRLFVVKMVIAVVLFVSASVVYRLEAPWAKEVRQFVAGALTEDMDFSRAASWYEKTFSGAPSLLPAFGSKQEAAKVQGNIAQNRFVLPVKGAVQQAFTDKQEGIWLSTRADAQTAAMDEGRIEFAGEKTDTGHTLIIRHANGYRTTYGGLKPTKWEAGDWVKAGEVIGTASLDDNGKGAVYLAVMKDERYINPLDVVSFD